MDDGHFELHLKIKKFKIKKTEPLKAIENGFLAGAECRHIYVYWLQF